MIEFNLLAKEENPLVSMLGTEVYMLLKEAKLGGASALYPDLDVKTFNALADVGHVSEIIGKLNKQGWYEGGETADLPHGLIELFKKSSILYLTYTMSAWEKLEALINVLILSDPPKDLVHKAEENAFKIIVSGYGIVKKPDGKIKWVLPKGHPAGDDLLAGMEDSEPMPDNQF